MLSGKTSLLVLVALISSSLSKAWNEVWNEVCLSVKLYHPLSSVNRVICLNQAETCVICTRGDLQANILLRMACRLIL